MIYAIVGNGGLARELKAYIDDSMKVEYLTYISSEYHKGDLDYQQKVYTVDDLVNLINVNPDFVNVIIAMANPIAKEKIIKVLPSNTKYFTYIHPSSIIYSKNTIGVGCIVAPNVVITTDVKIGNHCLINCNTSIGHDTIIGDYCTINPGAAISGNCLIGASSFFGAGSSIRENTSVAEYTTIGMGGVVIKNIVVPSKTWIGVPVKEI